MQISFFDLFLIKGSGFKTKFMTVQQFATNFAEFDLVEECEIAAIQGPSWSSELTITKLEWLGELLSPKQFVIYLEHRRINFGGEMAITNKNSLLT